MIDTNTAGTTISSAFTSRLEASFLHDASKFDLQVHFCRKIDGVWHTRDLSKKLVSHGDISREFGAQYGVSRGQNVDFVFDNAPIGLLQYDYEATTTIKLKPQFNKFTIKSGDWISICSFDNTEARRVKSIYYDEQGRISAIQTYLPFTGDYEADSTIKYVPLVNPTNDKYDTSNLYVGTIRAVVGFADINEYVCFFQGESVGGREIFATEELFVISCRDILQKLVEYQLEERFEVDKHGLASVPTPHADNVGDGEIDDIEYNEEKHPAIKETDTWTLTFDASDEEWDLAGATAGAIGSFVADNTDDLPGFREWTIDRLTQQGFKTKITEGDVPYEDGDTYRFYTLATGTVGAVKGTGYATNPIDTANLTDLKPLSIFAYVFEQLLGWEAENPLTGDSFLQYDLSKWLTGKNLSQNNFSELWGSFDAGTYIVEVIDDLLRPILGWAYATAEDRIGLGFFNAEIFNTTPPVKTLSINYDPSRRKNVLSIEANPFTFNSKITRVKFLHGAGAYRQKESIVDDPNATDAGARPLVIRAEDFAETDLQTRFTGRSLQFHNSSQRIFNRYRHPLLVYSMATTYDALLLEPNDIALLYALRAQRANEKLWITRTSFNILTGSFTLSAERAQELATIKTAIYHRTEPPPAVTTIWNGASGYVGTSDDYLLGWYADEDNAVQLDVIGNNDTDFDEVLGTADPRGFYVEQAYRYA